QNLDFSKQEKGEVRMCEVAQELISEGRQQGIQEGIQQGRQQGKRQGKQETLIQLVRDGLISASEAANRLGISESSFNALLVEN
ncbi:MAG: hypothetical protein LUF92_16875, partial [Clostridiales bacterium]|nr:hypothetical protein [Clostridiales bacterium]